MCALVCEVEGRKGNDILSTSGTVLNFIKSEEGGMKHAVCNTSKVPHHSVMRASLGET